MTREQANNYLQSSGFSNEQIKTIAKAYEHPSYNRVKTELDCISRQELKDLGAECIAKRDENGKLIPLGNIDIFPSVSTEKTDAYKQGWHDAIITALKETHSIHTEDGPFRVVQEETLIGVGMAYEQVSTEKTGYWIDDNDGHGTSCSKCGKWYPHSYLTKQEIIYCCKCGAKMEAEE